MAIDTADKRFSVLGMGRTNPQMPLPDGTIDSGDMYQILFSYRGITWDTGGEPEYLLMKYMRALFPRITTRIWGRMDN